MLITKWSKKDSESVLSSRDFLRGRALLMFKIDTNIFKLPCKIRC